MATTSNFLTVLQTSPQDFLQPSLPLYTDAIAYLKHILDPLAKDLSAEQQKRQQLERKKRKRGQDGAEEQSVLRLKQIHAQGFGVEQVWEQVRRVIDAAETEAERVLGKVPVSSKTPNGDTSSIDEDEEDDEVSDEVSEEDEDISDDDDETGLDEQVEDADDVDIDTEDDDDGFLSKSEDEEGAAEFVADKFGLNDGFFSIDDFNRQSEFLEQQDGRRDEQHADSDEEEVDWDANPLANGLAAAAANEQNGDNDAEESAEEDDAGPVFGDPDALSEDEDEIDDGELDNVGGMSNANEVMYKDFFAPPAQKKKKNPKNKSRKPDGSGLKTNGELTKTEDDMERTRDAVHRDLFEDDLSEQEEDDVDETAGKLDPSDPRSRQSHHERRKAALAETIRKLEAANVAKREWMLSGEARAADRPMNSLLEQDLEFERAGKPIPVITAEVSEDIESLIKRRIIAHDFNDLIRRRPDDLATGNGSRRGRLDFELDDSKSKKGLAEELEEDHLRRTDPNFTSAEDEKLSKEQSEISAEWKQVCGLLDALSSYNSRPKQPLPQLEIRVNAPVIAMEDARPNATGIEAATATTSQLAPQEVYKGGEASKGVGKEVVGKSGLPAGREELSREEKKRRRRREKERIRKGSGNGNGNENSGGGDGGPQKQEGKNNGGGKKAEEKKALIGDLKKGGVKVIGKKGEIRDVEGKRLRDGGNGDGQGAARFKL